MEEPIGQLPNPTSKSGINQISDSKFLVSRKRKNDENIENGDSKTEVKNKKLKWETIINKKCEAHIEHAIFYSKEEAKELYEKVEKQVIYLK
jgi:hypothetical protein